MLTTIIPTKKNNDKLLSDTAISLASFMCNLPDKKLNELRLLSNYNLPEVFHEIYDKHTDVMQENIDDWISLTRCIALLSNNYKDNQSIHSSRIGMGRSLACAGLGAKTRRKPVLSESRFQTLMRASKKNKGSELKKCIGIIAITFKKDDRINVVDLAKFLCSNDTKAIERKIAQDYYNTVFRMSLRTDRVQ